MLTLIKNRKRKWEEAATIPNVSLNWRRDVDTILIKRRRTEAYGNYVPLTPETSPRLPGKVVVQAIEAPQTPCPVPPLPRPLPRTPSPDNVEEDDESDQDEDNDDPRAILMVTSSRGTESFLLRDTNDVTTMNSGLDQHWEQGITGVVIKNYNPALLRSVLQRLSQVPSLTSLKLCHMALGHEAAEGDGDHVVQVVANLMRSRSSSLKSLELYDCGVDQFIALLAEGLVTGAVLRNLHLRRNRLQTMPNERSDIRAGIMALLGKLVDTGITLERLVMSENSIRVDATLAFMLHQARSRHIGLADIGNVTDEAIGVWGMMDWGTEDTMDVFDSIIRGDDEDAEEERYAMIRRIFGANRSSTGCEGSDTEMAYHRRF